MAKGDASDFIDKMMRESGAWVCTHCSNSNWIVWIPKEKDECPNCHAKRPANEANNERTIART
jgi:ssDNA-binding Zn-finger/Zn-ribbon topoisomerase 1